MVEHRSTTRILDILELIAHSTDEKMTLSNISHLLEAPKGTIYPMLQTLVQRGYLNYDADNCRYSIGALCYEIGMQYINNGSLQKDIDEILRHITDECQETSHFAELIGNEVFYLGKKDSPQSIRMFSSPGKKLPAYATGLGKALLCEKSEEEIKALYPNGLYAITDKTVTSFERLFEQLRSIRECGLAYEVEESNQYIRCIAVPIKTKGHIKYAISVAVPIFRYTLEKEQQIQALLVEAKKRIEESILPQ